MKTRVGVMRGGISSEYDVSLKTGATVLNNIPEQYKGVDILIDKKGEWHLNGLPITPARLSQRVDVIFNALHGYYGEDGKVQKILQHFKIPYTGSNALASAIGMNKLLSKKRFAKQGLSVAQHGIVRSSHNKKEEMARIFQTVSPPWVVKPISGGSSVGVSIVEKFDDLHTAVENALQHDSAVLVEEYIKGKEVTCGVIDGMRGEKHYALPPVEIIPPVDSFYDYEAKYGEGTQHLCPSGFSLKIKKELMRRAVLAHKAVGAEHYSRSDFIVSPRGIHILEINTLPGLTEHSNVPYACEAVGISLPSLIDHLLKLAISRK